ncbi:MAG TPA: M23 family metallopeptidase [Chthoniobacteraceae bacterium]|jgi:murein DD-endopeptidase MepM/ murein hydrolase activator NlpD|nr:M23 family metallopeptidase [Chthoniobacteraceae bacterium]
MRWPLLCLAAWLSTACILPAQDTSSVRAADGFSIPVGLDGAKKYYKARGFRPNGHLGEDWNGAGGGDTDLGDPVYCTAHGLVVYARDYRAGWGNVVIVRHAFNEKSEVRYVDSLYGHLDRILVREGQKLERGQRVGTIGTGHGRYPAHLHFEIRKDIRVGMYRSMFPRDFRTYFDPTQFILARQSLDGGGRTVSVPINTFPNEQNFADAEKFAENNRGGGDRPSPVRSNGRRMEFEGGLRWSANTGQVHSESDKSKPKKPPFQVDRYEDIRGR